MSETNSFILGVFLSFTFAFVVFYILMKKQKQKIERADSQYQWTLKVIELRNRKYTDDKTKQL